MNTKWLLLQNDQNADTTLLHSHDELCHELQYMHDACTVQDQAYYKYSLIAFDKRVGFLASARPVTACACVYVALFAHRLTFNHYVIAHAYNAANAHAQDGDRARWSQKVTLSSKAIRV